MPLKVLVTGGGSGLGRAFCKAVSELGCDVLVIDKDGFALGQLHEDFPGSIVGKQLDLSDRNAVTASISQLAEAGPFDLVILNAGISATGRFEAIPQRIHRKVLEVNLVAPMLIANGLMGAGALSPGAGIVFISSLSHAVGYPGAASYAASKDGISVYAKSIRKPFGRKGVSVTCAYPGPIRTAHAERHAPAGAKADRRSDPDDVAAAILKHAMAGRAVCFPGFTAKVSRLAGRFFPGLMARSMRKVIFEKLDGEVY